MRRSICTSEPRRASTRVSSGFTLFEHSSPSYGSHRARSDRNGAESATVRRRCATYTVILVSFTSVEPLCYDLPRTRAHVRLLGPCFKTGPMRPESSASLSLYVEGGQPRIRDESERLARPSTRATLQASIRWQARRTGRLVAPRPNPPYRMPVRATR